MEYLLALDLGTSGLKAVLFDTSGAIGHGAGCSYETKYGPSGEAEQDPADWWEAVGEVVRSLERRGADLSGITALAISGHMMGLVAVGPDGTALGNALIHADTRASGEAAHLAEMVGMETIYRVTGHRASASYSGPKMVWLARNDPDRYGQARSLLNPKDYLNLQLTGVTCTDQTDASGTLLFDIARGEWSRDLTEAAGLDMNKLPEIVPSTTVVGKVTAAAAAQTGLPQGTAVVAGAGDGLCAGVGAGSVTKGRAYNYLGTTSWVATTTESPLIDPQMRVFTFAHAVPGLYHPMGTMQTAGGAVDWFCETSLGHLHDRSEAYRKLDALVAQSPAGSRGLVFLPYLLGERSPWWDPECAGGWFGLRQIHGLADQARAVLEGVAANLSLIAATLREFAPFESLLLLGGGGLSKHWPQMLCDGYNTPLSVLTATQSATARGAAVIAGVGAGVFDDFSIAADLATASHNLKPTAEGAKKMQELRDRLVDVFTRLYRDNG